ncbi:MAG: hypothetical protein LBP63_00725 [Prevotellaceae bacterium]|jgi:hypothetical protein|nr:hypothetical protein [Prevotellaceae bacterium]
MLIKQCLTITCGDTIKNHIIKPVKHKVSKPEKKKYICGKKSKKDANTITVIFRRDKPDKYDVSPSYRT